MLELGFNESREIQTITIRNKTEKRALRFESERLERKFVLPAEKNQHIRIEVRLCTKRKTIIA